MPTASGAMPRSTAGSTASAGCSSTAAAPAVGVTAGGSPASQVSASISGPRNWLFVPLDLDLLARHHASDVRANFMLEFNVVVG